ncbi:hypothetical protein ONS96_010160 [Cadophora gregata f. sp. sojae]|nr:hypothetical protein ONS96_010160 [Cadophora gregata f. sp. sojae]
MSARDYYDNDQSGQGGGYGGERRDEGGYGGGERRQEGGYSGRNNDDNYQQGGPEGGRTNTPVAQLSRADTTTMEVGRDMVEETMMI